MPLMKAHNQSLMGQTHTRASAPVELVSAPAACADERRTNNPAHHTLPARRPAHAKTNMQHEFSRDSAPNEDDPQSRTLPQPRGLTTKPKGIARKLSHKTKTSHTPFRSLEAQLQVFEQMVKAAELRAEGENGPPVPDKIGIADHGLFMLRHAISQDDLFSGPMSAPPGHMGVPSPTILNKSKGSANRPTHHRRSSSGSIHSGRMSIKSTRSAEREWRARVSAIAATAASQQQQSTPSDIRGPVPPKRTPGRHDITAASPVSDVLVTPPPIRSAEPYTPAKSLNSSLSFETFGRHGSPYTAGNAFDSSSISIRERKASVPLSVASSFYFDPLKGGSNGATRPPSLAASHILPAAPVQASSPLRQSFSPRVDEGDSFRVADTGVGHLNLPSFDKYRLDSVMIPSPRLPTSLELPEVAPEPSSSDHHVEQAVPKSNHIKKLPSHPTEVELREAVPRAGDNLDDLDVASGSPSPNLNPNHGTAPEEQGKQSTKRNNTTGVSTPLRKQRRSVPSTPLSPVTAYFLSAPIESIDMSRVVGIESPERPGHPFAIAPVPTELPGSTSRNREILPEVKRDPRSDRNRLSGMSSLQRPLDCDTYTPRSLPIKSKKKKDKETKKSKSGERERDNRQPLAPARKTQSKAMVVGEDLARAELERQREKLRKMGVDLTLGMESGNRPPKSGMPINELQRWLLQTST
ncbi:hypothetical protein DB88DRAFT_536948 [Papiliotrema laurentii]|uniref:Uncharacterized protein n=1 Tax=Papiliotrema laurentii TaxID=5418 RepID=A0AAD9L950_PAPLA|nr:hypothetical protein DB88DRAFT_536948 [Papiliotrema laurentii]